MPVDEPTPPIRELPAEIEAAIMDVVWSSAACGRNRPAEPDELDAESWQLDARATLHETIRAALDERDTALRERCERLRQIVALANLERDSVRNECFDVWAECGKRIGERLDTLQPGDLADDLHV